MNYLVTYPFSAHRTGDGKTPEESVGPGEIVEVTHVEHGPLPEDTVVTFIRPNGESWTALFDSGDPFIAPFQEVKAHA